MAFKRKNRYKKVSVFLGILTNDEFKLPSMRKIRRQQEELHR